MRLPSSFLSNRRESNVWYLSFAKITLVSAACMPAFFANRCENVPKAQYHNHLCGTETLLYAEFCFSSITLRLLDAPRQEMNPVVQAARSSVFQAGGAPLSLFSISELAAISSRISVSGENPQNFACIDIFSVQGVLKTRARPCGSSLRFRQDSQRMKDGGLDASPLSPESVPCDLSMCVPICPGGHQKNIRKYPCQELYIAALDSCSSHHSETSCHSPLASHRYSKIHNCPSHEVIHSSVLRSALVL